MTKTTTITPPWEEIAAERLDVALASENPAIEPDSEEPVSPEKVPIIDEIATEFVRSWNRLVSQTNWEKGSVIHTWRTRLVEAGLPRSIYSDDAIARRIGNVSGQHVGRLRRVYEQFDRLQQYDNLYWSHYQAALDWEDADFWLSKAADESLSVAMMRIARWEKYGAPPERKPKENEIVLAERDEDVNPFNDSESGFGLGTPGDSPERGEGRSDDKPESGKKGTKVDEIHESGSSPTDSSQLGYSSLDAANEPAPVAKTADVISTLHGMASLPDDFSEAFEQLKVAVLSRKLTNWDDVSAVLILQHLATMRQLVVAED